MAIEIEVKARINTKDAIIQKLASLGCILSDPRIQDDTVYVEQDGSLATFLSNKVFLRIRVQNDGKVLLTAKQPKTKSAENLIKHEYEVTVDSVAEAHGILTLMGYQAAVRVKKVRQTAEYEGYEICLDDIEGLGSFIEIEAIGDEQTAEITQEKLSDFLTSLGIPKEDRVTKGYDILILEKRGA
jgi:adenylate cyclase class 2